MVQDRFLLEVRSACWDWGKTGCEQRASGRYQSSFCHLSHMGIPALASDSVSSAAGAGAHGEIFEGQTHSFKIIAYLLKTLNILIVP